MVIPEEHQETLTLDIGGVRVGFAHGHQVGRPDRVPDWWKGQAFGRQPLASADLLLLGHFHHLRVQHVGGRTMMIAPTLDNGSSWYESISGESSQNGLLTFTISDGQWDNLRVL